MNNFINRIIEYRKAKGITQKKMAEKLSTTQVNYSNLENGKTQLTLEKLVRIANVLDVDIITLLYPDFNEAKYNQELKKENFRLNKINELLIDLVETKNTVLGIILQTYPETKHLIEGHKSFEELEALGLRKKTRERMDNL